MNASQNRNRAASFLPPLGLRNGHIQSILAASDLRQRRAERAAARLIESCEPVILDCGEGVRLEGLYNAATTSGPARGTVILLHGWEGTARSGYLILTGQHLIDSGFDVVRLHYRDHGDTHHLNRGIFHSCRIREVVGAVGAVEERYRPERLLVVGFSLGGNFALRVGLRAPAAGIDVAGIVAVNPVIDPTHTMHALEGGWRFYEQHYIGKWKRSLARKQALWPDVYDLAPCQKMTSLREITTYLAQSYSEFDTLEDYLDGYCIGGDRLAALDVPSRIVTAEDDPIIPIDDFHELDPSGLVTLETTRYGGHCGFLDGYGLESWLESRIAEHLAA